MPERKVDLRFYTFRDSVQNNPKAAEEMLARNPDLIRLSNGIGETALHFLAVEDHLEEVSWLIEHGAAVDSLNDFNQTPLMEVAGAGRLEMCKLLVSHGANIRYVSPWGESVLSAAASHDQVEVVDYLLGLLPPEEGVNKFFENVDAEMTLKHSPKCTVLLTPRGLTKRWP
ncbi:MAG TPA: ankyrin repeat domain-containing protein [Chthoniobacter sp.]|nr:ankyrin repeat domain-containing protein [Chthoniobacter sp.]